MLQRELYYALLGTASSRPVATQATVTSSTLKVVTLMPPPVSARTAGFNTVDLANMHTITKCMMCILMFIGAAVR